MGVGCTDAAAGSGSKLEIYRSRSPQSTGLYQLVQENWPYFTDHLDPEIILKTWTKKTFKRFLECGLPEYGFARAHCDACGYDYLVAFSCQMRGVCPSCAGKRFQVFSRFAMDQVIELVPHCQVVLTLPWVLRGYCHKPGTRNILFRAMKETLQVYFATHSGHKTAKPGIIAVLQTFGDKLNFHPHLHCLVTQGAWVGDTFHPLAIKRAHYGDLAKIFALKVFEGLIAEGLIGLGLKEQWLGWKHTGFSVDASVQLSAPQGHEDPNYLRLLRYIARPPISNERVCYDAQSGCVTLFSTKKTLGRRRVVDTISPFEFLKRLAAQVPPKGTHLIRYYGHYASRTRSVRNRNAQAQAEVNTAETTTPKASKSGRRSWAQLIRKVFEVNPLACKHCGKEMKIIALIQRQQTGVIEPILDALKIKRQTGEPRGPPRWLQVQQASDYIDQHQDLYPEGADSLDQDPDSDTTLLYPA